MEIPKEICEKCKPLFLQLLKRIEHLEAKNKELERRLAMYENAHTPPSKNNRYYPKQEKSSNHVGELKKGMKEQQETFQSLIALKSLN